MKTTTVTARDFNREPSRVKKAAALGPVIVTERGRPAHVIMSFSEFQRLSGGRRTLADLAMSLPDPGEVDTEPEISQNWGFKIPDLP